ncbi:hypothetical protein KBC03_07525 [Patescibacteria group bacterium]|nr:hypothetical protein [Patescibacteria group bacterium]
MNTMDLAAMLDETVKIIKKYYAESAKTPVLEFQSPQELARDIDLRIQQKGIPLKKLFPTLEKIALRSPRTSSK